MVGFHSQNEKDRDCFNPHRTGNKWRRKDMTNICPVHGVSYMPSGKCYYCVLEGRAQDIQNEADESAKEEKSDDQVSA